MKLTPYPHQIEGAAWLSSRQYALLADEPRVGKTGTAIMAADDNFEENLLVVTTASGKPVWNRAFHQWSQFDRDNVMIVGWPDMYNNGKRALMMSRNWDRIILDESHFAKNFDAKRTQAVYGVLEDGGLTLNQTTALVAKAKGVWRLSGTPIPNTPIDLYPELRALHPELLLEDKGNGWPDVTRFEDFRNRYTHWYMKKISAWNRVPVVTKGRREDELAARIAGIWLKRTQKDVGILEPIYETWPIAISPRLRRQIEADLDQKIILDAAEAGDTRTLEMHMGPLRRITGEIKAEGVIRVVEDEMESGLDKIVLAYWHTSVGGILKEGLSKYGLVGIDGSTPNSVRGEAEQRFLHDPKIRVFLGQIQAAGEAIDLSSASELMFVESSFMPKDMAQMSKRITNHTQKRQPRVRVASLEGSVDEALEGVLLRKWSSIKKVFI